MRRVGARGSNRWNQARKKGHQHKHGDHSPEGKRVGRLHTVEQRTEKARAEERELLAAWHREND